MTRNPNLRTRRGSVRGLTSIETVLATAAVMGCFVYPLSLAIRGVGAQLANEAERSHDALLEQRR